MRCDQFAVARRPLPANYMHPDFKDVEAAVPAMGNHLVDLTGPEFNKSRPRACFPIKATPAVGRSGFYPTVSCLRHEARTGDYTVSMEGFVFREAQAPAPGAR